MTRTHVRALGALALATASAVPAIASANPRPLPFTYPYGTLPQGSFEIEQYVDVDPVKALSTETGVPATYVATQFQTEFELGLTDHLELGVYASFVPQPSDSFSSTPVLPEGNGAKERLRGRFAEEGQWPIDVALYGEVVENEREIELEAKAILARRIGRLHIDLNLSSEFEFYYSGAREIVLNPSVGLTYQVASFFHPGFEYWLLAEFPVDDVSAPGGFNRGPHHYLGPTMMFEVGPAWWSTGFYCRVSDVFHPITPGDSFGPLWFRSVIGFGL